MHIEEKQLKDFIIDSGLVSRADVLTAEEEAKKSDGNLGKVLVKSGKLTDDSLSRMQAYILGIPYVDLKGENIPFDVLSLIPEPIARNHNIVAFKKTDDSLEVAMLNVEDLAAIDFIKKKVDLKILPRLTDPDSIKSAILQYQKNLKAEFGDLIAKDSAVVNVSLDDSKTLSGEDLQRLAEDVPVVRIVDTLLSTQSCRMLPIFILNRRKPIFSSDIA
jgi:type IV pilus assembly protein PilB